ncbi:hypothetical protein JCM1841_000913 [Sporobolomyces salmonicolor]
MASTATSASTSSIPLAPSSLDDSDRQDAPSDPSTSINTLSRAGQGPPGPPGPPAGATSVRGAPSGASPAGGDSHQHGQNPPSALAGKQTGFTIRKPNRPPLSSDSVPRPPPSALNPSPAQPVPPTTTPSPTPQSSQPQQTPIFPALHLTPLNNTFVPKQISLEPPGSRVKIGRQTNAKTVPNGTNGYFDSKVLSRAHAEVWSEDNKVFIKDVKSSNGTFINGERLSPESAESDVFELHTDDVVEFGIDILTDDTKTIVHHKVAAKVHLVLNADDAIASSREFNNWYRQAGEQSMGRRPQRAPVNAQNGLSFEHVLSRLQGELQKSRDTGSNLSDVNTTLNDVHDTLGGGAPPPLPRGAAALPYGSLPPRNDQHAQSIAALQSQLTETQNSLAGHVGKIRDLEGLLAEHEVIKHEVGTLRQQMEEAQLGMKAMMHERKMESVSAPQTNGRESPIAALLDAQEAAEDDDDARSVSSVDTISPSRGADGRSSDGPLSDDETTSEPAPSATSRSELDLSRERLLQEQNAKLTTRLDALSAELDEAIKLGQQLRTQHAEAYTTIRLLEDRIAGLEKAVESRVAQAEGRALQQAEERWTGWRDKFEENWKLEKEGWDVERDKLTALVREWEERKREKAMAGRASSDDSDNDNVDAGGAADATGDVSPSSTTETSSQSGKKSRSRRRKRTTTAASSSGLKSTGGPSSTVGSKLAGVVAEGLASDSDSTIGGGGPAFRRGSGTFGRRPVPTGAAGVRDAEKNSQSAHGLPVSWTGAVVVLAVAVGYGAAMKLKE